MNRIHKDSYESIHNYKNKIKRLNQPGLSNKKNIPSIVSTTKNVISNSSNIHEVINKQLVKLQQKPALLNCTLNVNGVYNICCYSLFDHKINLYKLYPTYFIK